MADVVYQVLFSAGTERRKLCSLHQSAGPRRERMVDHPSRQPQSTRRFPDERALSSASNLSYGDAIENVFAWKSQAFVGNETTDRVDCVILESKPGEGDHSNYGACAAVWIDTRRMVPLRVEKYFASGRLGAPYRHTTTPRRL